MSWFRRDRADKAAKAQPEVAAAAEESPAAPESAAGSQPATRPSGPFDESDRPDLDGLIDLGALRLPGREGMELRLELEEATQRVIAATVQLGGSAVQLQAFAAPRTEGIWDEIRREIAASVTRQGGTADEVPGTFGTELLARVPAPQGGGAQPARFAGIDGPRWFVRAVFHGAAVHDPAAAVELEEIVRGVVVVRGGEAMAPRDLLSLRLPEDARAAQEPEPAPVGAPQVPQRGPEITELR